VPISDRSLADGTGTGAEPARGLLAHAAYACRHSGVCCTSNWEIPVEHALHDRLADALAAGTLRPAGPRAAGDPPLVARDGLPRGQRSVLGRTQGRCVFHAGGDAGCRLHAWGGADAKPIACRQFPWIAVHDPRGTSVSLSHVCPTAAALLDDPALLLLAPLPGDARRFDGLDVRRALPPAIDDRRLLDWDALSAWETQALDACARAPRPMAVVADLRALRAHAARWSPGQGPLARWIGAWTPTHTPRGSAASPARALDVLVRAAVPAGLAVSSAMPASGIDAAWHDGAPLVRRYLAARLIACWPLHYGVGLATVQTYAEALLAVLAGELARRTPPDEAPDDAVTLAAIAEADRIVVHLCAPDALAGRLDRWASRSADGGL
jgi:Fe-S-cluster containining protein